MAWPAYPWALVPLAAAMLAASTAVFVLANGRGGGVNRLLAGLLFLEALAVGVSAIGAIPATDAAFARASYNAGLLHAATDVPIACLYLLFLGAALRTPLVAPFTRPRVRIALGVVAVAGAIPPFVAPELYIPGFRALDEPGALFAYEAGIGPLFPVGWLALVGTFVYGLVASVSAWRGAESGAERERARLFVLAFGTRDLLWGATFAALVGIALVQAPASTFQLTIVAYAAVTLLYIPVLAYAILKAQLFDIDVRLKLGIRRGTLAAAFVAVFFVVSELAASLLTARMGAVLGVVAAGLLVFALAPLQRMAERVSDAALPGVTNTPEYLRYRKFEVYKAALVSATRDGVTTERERATLEVLRRELGIAEADARAMEQAMAPPAGSAGGSTTRPHA